MKVFVRFYYTRMSVNIKRTTVAAKTVHFVNVFPNILAMHMFCSKIKFRNFCSKNLTTWSHWYYKLQNTIINKRLLFSILSLLIYKQRRCFFQRLKNRFVFLIRSNTYKHVRLIIDTFSTIQLNIYGVEILSYKYIRDRRRILHFYS